MNVVQKVTALVILSLLSICPMFHGDARADVEMRLPLSRIELDSLGLDTSGPVHVEASQSDKGVLEIKILAFGKLQTLAPSQLARLEGLTFNSVGLSYSRGYKNMGGSGVYLLLCQGFSGGNRVVAVITVNEQGGVTVDKKNTTKQ
jgi:hypothetical protein